jgi:hypothetical protein
MEVSMRIRGIPGAAALAMVWLLLPGSSSAHHAVGSEFDVKNCREFTGILTRLDWENPHTHFFLDVKDATGKVESWSFQAYSTLTMRRAGTERQELLDNIGKEVWVRGCLARSGTERKAAAGTLKFADGRVREVGQLQDDRGNR